MKPGKYRHKKSGGIANVVGVRECATYEWCGRRCELPIDLFLDDFEPVPDEPVIAAPGTFEWAVVQHKAGKSVQRGKYGRRWLYSNQSAGWLFDPCKDRLVPTNKDDLNATDWKIYEVPK